VVGFVVVNRCCRIGTLSGPGAGRGQGPLLDRFGSPPSNDYSITWLVVVNYYIYEEGRVKGRLANEGGPVPAVKAVLARTGGT